MHNTNSDFLVLDVGCGVTPHGTVNMDFIERGENLHVGAVMNPHAAPNFILADATHLPFKDAAFNVVYSSHVIEHVPDPQMMFSEICRVASKRAIIRCPHKRGSGAKRPHHINYIDEEWFTQAAQKVGVEHQERMTVVDFPISNRLPQKVINKINKGPVWRVVRHAEWLVSKKFGIAWEVECQVKKSCATFFTVVELPDRASVEQLAHEC